jgi:diamine N-acetyltransferase
MTVMSDGQESPLTVREWEERDLESVRRITWKTWRASYASFIPERDMKWYFDQHYTIKELGTLWRSSHFRGYLAFVGEIPAGYAKANYSVDEHKLYVQSMYVLPEYQGKGLGHLLLGRAEQRAREYDLDRIWLGVMTHNTAALAWYRRNGFHFVEEAPFLIGETTVQHLIGYRLLSGVNPESRE